MKLQSSCSNNKNYTNWTISPASNASLWHGFPSTVQSITPEIQPQWDTKKNEVKSVI